MHPITGQHWKKLVNLQRWKIHNCFPQRVFENFSISKKCLPSTTQQRSQNRTQLLQRKGQEVNCLLLGTVSAPSRINTGTGWGQKQLTGQPGGLVPHGQAVLGTPRVCTSPLQGIASDTQFPEEGGNGLSIGYNQSLYFVLSVLFEYQNLRKIGIIIPVLWMRE